MKKAIAKALTLNVLDIGGVLGIGGYFFSPSIGLTLAAVFMGYTGGIVEALGLAVDCCDGNVDGWLRW